MTRSGNGVRGPELKSSSPAGSGVSPSSGVTPGSDVPPGSCAPANCGDTDCCSCTVGISISHGGSRVTCVVPITLLAGVSTRNESWGLSVPGPREKPLSRLGNDFDGRFLLQYPRRRNGCGDENAVSPYHISCGDMMSRLGIGPVRFLGSDAPCTGAVRRVCVG